MMKRTPLLASLALAALCSAQAAKLTVWVIGDESAPKIFQPAADLYHQAHPETTFEVRAVPGDQAFTKYLSALASRSGPDIITGYLSYGIELGKKGGLVNLKQKYPDLVKSVLATSNPALVKSISGVDGSLYALPYDQTVQLLYFRTDLVKAPPKTWADMTKLVEQQQAAGNKGFAQQWGNAGWVGYFPFFAQAGGSLYDAGCTKATVNSQAGVDALKYYSAFYTKYKAPTDGWPDIETGLESGNYPISMTGNWDLLGIQTGKPKIAGKWAVAKLPAGPTGKTTAFAGGSLIGITSYSPNADLAADFLKSMYSTRSTVAMIKAANTLGSLWLPAGRQDLASQVSLPASQKAVLTAQLKDTQGPPNCPGWEQSGDALQKAIQGVIFSGTDPKAALDSVASAMNANLTKYK